MPMKKFLCLNCSLGLAALLVPGCASKPKPAPAVVYQEVSSPAVRPAPKPSPPYYYEQKVMGAPAARVTEEQAQTIVNRFKEAYPKLGSPRLLIYVNRELVDAHSGIKLVRRDERVERSRGGTNAEPSIQSVEKNTYRPDD